MFIYIYIPSYMKNFLYVFIQMIYIFFELSSIPRVGYIFQLS